MARLKLRLFALSVLLLAAGMPAWAETSAPTESVTVSATKLREVLHEFLKGFVEPTARVGKIARWERHICPLVVGQNSHFTSFITQRIKSIAEAVGAPVNNDASCSPNIEVVFTSAPQALLDNVRRNDFYYLGYAESKAELDKLATVTRPVQAWYMTESVDANGTHFTDSDILPTSNGANAMFEPVHYNASASRISNGIKSGFKHVLIVVDSTKLAGEKIVPLADYISLLALTRVNTLDGCQQLESVANMLVPGCGQATEGLTRFDMAYLQGQYRMIASRDLMFQRNDIAAIMADALMPKE